LRRKNMETKHTPGPWEVMNNYVKRVSGAVIATTARQNSVCRFEAEVGSSEDGANARLIAAAPELLDALNHARELIKAARGYFPKSIKNPDTFRLENTNATIEAAIAKAKGDK
jgi:hypothetical protein